MCVRSAEEYGHLIEAGQIGAAHELLVHRIASPLFCSRLQPSLQRLEQILGQLQPHAEAPELAHGNTPWRIGAGLYSTHFALKVWLKWYIQARLASATGSVPVM